MEQTKKYVVVAETITHEEVEYSKGSFLQLTDAEARELGDAVKLA